MKPLTLSDKIVHFLVYGILALGIALRTVTYLHKRCLILDEVNIVRNLYERSFTKLVAPLSYEQYAPPLFLFMSKTIACLFGFGELSLRLFPFICGIVSLVLLQRVLAKLVTSWAALYSLLLMATGYIFIRYSTELKQYSSDIVISMGLIYLALDENINESKKWSFATIWTIAGSLAIWASMPSVFILAGVFFRFFITFYKEGLRRLLLLIFPAIVWAVQFIFYYFLVLRHASSSEYLQTWHREYFISLLPRSGKEFSNNLELMNKMLSAAGGATFLALMFHCTLIVLGLSYLWRKSRSIFLLLIVPFPCLFIAAGMHKFTLVPRVILFALPLLLIMMAAGWHRLLQIKMPVVKIVAIAFGVICVVNYGRFDYLFRPLEVDEITDGMAIAQKEGINGPHLYVNYLIGPVFEFYTKIHPCRAHWAGLANANITQYETNMDSLMMAMHGHNAMLYVGLDEQLRNNDLATARKYFSTITEKKITGGYLYLLDRK